MADSAWVDIHEIFQGRVPGLNWEFWMRKLNSLIENSLHWGVLNGDNEWLVSMIRYGTVQISSIGYDTMSPIMRWDASIFVWKEIDHLFVLIEVSIDRFDVSQGVIISDILFGSASGSIMMLIDSLWVKKNISCGNYICNLAIRSILV